MLREFGDQAKKACSQGAVRKTARNPAARHLLNSTIVAAA
jgi:hypothetical protein